MVVSRTIANFEVKRIHVDDGSSVDILHYKALEKMKISKDQLRLIKTPLVSFIGNLVQVEGIITCPLLSDICLSKRL